MVIKRDGTRAKFDEKKITKAIVKAMIAVREINVKTANSLTAIVMEKIKEKYGEGDINVESIQDIVVDTLSYNEKLMNCYASYRAERALAREVKTALNITDDLKLPANTLEILESRYLLKDETGKPIETPKMLFERVAKGVGVAELVYEYINEEKKEGNSLRYFGPYNIARAEKILKEKKVSDDKLVNFKTWAKSYGGGAIATTKEYYKLMSELKFLPNTPTLMNAGTDLGMLSACFVLPVGDDMESIFKAVRDTAMIHKSGGGTGFSFNSLRPSNDYVKSTNGVASGPVSFMKIFDAVTEEIKQGGKRRGANMGIIRYDHPDILEFVGVKDRENTKLRNFNISVAVDQAFFTALNNNGKIKLTSPRTGEVKKEIPARELFDAIVKHAWETGDPGLFFVDYANEDNFVPQLGEIEATNPCGEEPLHPYESCNLGSINLAKLVDAKGTFDEKEYERIIRLGVRFLDDVIDVNEFPVPELNKRNKETRRIGLGVMGFADMLVQMNIPYDSLMGLDMGHTIMGLLQNISYDESEKLGETRGTYSLFDSSLVGKLKNLQKPRRNSAVQSIAPTGTISIIADCSSSIEPYFALAYKRKYNAVGIQGGIHTLYVWNKYLEKRLREEGLWNDELVAKIAESGKLENLDLPEDIKALFKTAHEISPEWHIMMQGVFQSFCDSGVSKTINLPNSASKEDVARAYIMARELHCKGITIFRDGSKTEQVLTKINDKKIPLVVSVIQEGVALNGDCAHGSCDL
ncbi:MAG: adenosylcobalamin-dependent ribonucleoside-diphosphate reductase [Candidatus Parvarchaeum sp.]